MSANMACIAELRREESVDAKSYGFYALNYIPVEVQCRRGKRGNVKHSHSRLYVGKGVLQRTWLKFRVFYIRVTAYDVASVVR